jgi:AGCS family alanine or glycine:cation symporter
MDIAWNIADISQCVLAFINIPVCILIGSVAYKALADYRKQRKQGTDPVFFAKNCGITQETDFWKEV